MSEFWKRKMRRYFATFDYDNDGLISKDDLSEMAIRYSRFGKEDKQKAQHLKIQFDDLWEMWIKKAGTGNRDTITAEELILSLGKQRNDPELRKPYDLMIRDLHDMLDLNRDGYLQEDEYERIIFQLGVPDPSFTREAFRIIDVNGDGKLSIEEFLNAFFDFMFSDNEKSPNGFFFGPLGD